MVTDHDFSIFLALARSICRRDPREAFARFTARDLAVSPSTLSYRDVEELLRERGLDLSYETVRRRVLKADRRLDQLIALANEERFETHHPECPLNPTTPLVPAVKGRRRGSNLVPSVYQRGLPNNSKDINVHWFLQTHKLTRNDLVDVGGPL